MNRVSATSELAQQKDRNKQDLHLHLLSLCKTFEVKNILDYLGEVFLPHRCQRESERLLAKKKSDNKVWSKGNFLTGSNSFVLKGNKTLNQC